MNMYKKLVALSFAIESLMKNRLDLSTAYRKEIKLLTLKFTLFSHINHLSKQFIFYGCCAEDLDQR